MNEPIGQARHQKTITELGPWFHNVHLPDGTETAPDHALGDFPKFKWDCVAPILPEDMSGMTALDIGCNAGFYTMELAKRGAQVTAVDVDERYLSQARWVARQFGFEDRVRFEQAQVYDLAKWDQKFDLILFLGVFYHLRYPMLGMDIVTRLAGGKLLFQSLSLPGGEYDDVNDMDLMDRDRLMVPGWPHMAFLEHRLYGDPTNWWVPNESAVEAMLRSCGMRVVAKPGHEFFLAEVDPDARPAMRTWNEPEYLSATGQPWLDRWSQVRANTA